MNFESGGHLVAVEYDSDDTADALRARCARWRSDDTSDVPAPFGLRVARVGFRRRQIGVVHHGAPVRHRLPSLDAGVEAIAGFLGEMEQVVPTGLVQLDARLFVRDGRAVLLDLPLSVDVDERPLGRLGIEEVPTWRPLLDPSAGVVAVGDTSWPLAGVVVRQPLIHSLDDARRRLWSLGTGPHPDWADFIDALGEHVAWADPDLPRSLDGALSAD